MAEPTPTPAEAGSAKPVQPESAPPLPQSVQHLTQLMQSHDLIQTHMSTSMSPYSGPSVVPPSFRPAPQFSHVHCYPPNPIAAAPVQPPGIVPQVLGSVPAMQYHMPLPGQPPNPAIRSPFVPIHNGFVPPPQGSVAPPGIPRFPSPYPAMVRPIYPLRPPGVLPVVSRPPVPGTSGVRPIVPSVVRPTIPSVTPAEKPQTTVYVGKIATTVEDDFMLSLLLLCGQVRSWKRGRDPSGTPRGFGFCEFEYPEGVLRALRLLNRFNVDGQELLINGNQATKEYLERYIERKTENSRNLNESQSTSAMKDGERAQTDSKDVSVKASAEDARNVNEKDDKETHDLSNFGIVTNEDKESDHQILEKLTNIIEERLKSRPLPPPPPQSADNSRSQALESFAKSRDEAAIEEEATEDKNDDESTSENRAISDQERNEILSPDISQRLERRSRERDLRRDHEREIERYEREAERERIRKEREHRRKIEDAGRAYEERLKDWEYREREKEKQRQYEKDREKEKERKRRKEIQYDEEDDEDDKKRWRRSALEDKKRRRIQEKKEDLADRSKEEEEIMEARMRAAEVKLEGRAEELNYGNVINGNDKKFVSEEAGYESKDKIVEDYRTGFESYKGDAILSNGASDGVVAPLLFEAENRQPGPAKKLGFGLVGSGKRATVPSVFIEEDDDESHKEKKMRPLVPIDYSNEELQAFQPSVPGAQPSNLVAAAEYAKRISTSSRDEKHDADRERSRKNHDRSGQRERDHNYDDGHSRDENREKNFDRDRDFAADTKVKTPEKQSFLDAKQLIDMIPKTKDELFSYEINWSVYDKHKLHDRMRPWISKKITEFLGEEEATLVDYLVSGTQDHVQATQMLEMLQAILDDEAEMFVLKMWRMLIFEIKKVETGLAERSKA